MCLQVTQVLDNKQLLNHLTSKAIFPILKPRPRDGGDVEGTAIGLVWSIPVRLLHNRAEQIKWKLKTKSLLPATHWQHKQV